MAYFYDMIFGFKVPHIHSSYIVVGVSIFGVTTFTFSNLNMYIVFDTANHYLVLWLLLSIDWLFTKSQRLMLKICYWA